MRAINKYKSCIVTGVTGQDGAYLALLLLQKGYQVYGAYRRVSTVNFWRIDELGIRNHPNLHLVEFDITDLSSCISLIEIAQPHEIYNLAAQSFVGLSFHQPASTSQITGLGVLNILEAIRLIDRRIKFYQASTSEMYGKVQAVPQVETTPFYPRSPYGISKLYAHWMTINYRESYDIFACSGILFNHESPLRGSEFVTRKITDGVAKIKLGQLDCLSLGNIDASRDWGYAKDYVEGMWLMLQAERPDTYVLATNRAVSVRDFVRMSFESAGISVDFRGKGVDEIAVNQTNGSTVMKINPHFYRPAEVDFLLGDPSYAKKVLGWHPTTSLEDLCRMMVTTDLQRNQNGLSNQ